VLLLSNEEILVDPTRLPRAANIQMIKTTDIAAVNPPSNESTKRNGPQSTTLLTAPAIRLVTDSPTEAKNKTIKPVNSALFRGPSIE
jgi:hypothetical protein